MSPTTTPRCLYLMIAVSLMFSHWHFAIAQEFHNEPNADPVPFQKIVEFDKKVHFFTLEEKDVVIDPGGYLVEGVEKGLRLKSADSEEDEAIAVRAEAATHDLPMTSAEAFVTREGEDQVLLLLLSPDGKALQAVGTHSGIASRHPQQPTLKPGAFSGLAGLLPKITSILAAPAPPAYDVAPPGNLTPFGTLYLKGEQFGSSPGKVTLHVRVPIEKHFRAGVGAVSSPGSKPGTRTVQLEITQWSTDRITAKMPLVAGVPDHSVVLQVLNAQGLGSPGWQVPFYAMRANTTLQFGENVTEFQCAIGGNPTDVSACLNQVLKGSPGNPCFHSGKIHKEKTISAYHVNCDLLVDWDKGRDRYTIELKNGWVIREIRWGWNPHSTSEKLALPSAQTLTEKYKGASTITLWVPFEVSPGPDWLDYWIDVDAKGPAGILFGNRVYWKQ